MATEFIDPVERLQRRLRRARLLLGLVETIHYIVAAPAFLFFGLFLIGAASSAMERLANWGVVSWWDVRGLVVPVAGLAYGAGTVYSARLMDRRTRRGVSLAWATTHLLTVIFLPVALLTWAVLSLPSVRELYDGSALPFEPRLRPPPVPIPVMPVVLNEVAEGARGAGRRE